MKRIIILLVLVALAGIAGVVVRSSSSKGGTVAELRQLVSHDAADAVRDDIRQSFELSPGARVDVAGINGNIELQLPADVNADFDARGMNGRVIADLPNVAIDKGRHGTYWARIGNGGTGISAKGINGNIRLTTSTPPTPPSAATAATTLN
jgi:hypothetical protein